MNLILIFYAATGHTQYRGKRYCPKAPGQILREEWLQLQREEATAAKNRAQPSK